MTEIAFDDIEGLQAACTEEWGEWGPEYHMTQEKINTFADLTGDQQWIHVDEEKAAAVALLKEESASRRKTVEALLWAMLNTPEFVFKH